MSLNIIKVGGAVVEDAALRDKFLEKFAAVSGNKVLVHGGGRTATSVAARLGIETKMAEGRRITDAAMLDVVTMVYGGLVNKTIVARLQAFGVNALGLTGADMHCITAHKRPVKDIDYGFVGDVDAVNVDAFKMLLDAGVVPVVTPLSFDPAGNMLNTNADTIATEVAKALSSELDNEVTLTFCFEKKGVLSNPDDDNSVISVIDSENYGKLKAEGVISGGMIPKLDNAFSALRAGVSKVVITNAADLTRGTVVML